MQQPSTEPSRSARRRSGGWVGAAAVWAALVVCVCVPAIGVLFSAAGGPGGAPFGGLASPPLGPLARSLGYAGLIALLAVLLAWPAALVLARARPVWLVVASTPMLLPSYLAYAGWSIARAPTTPLGRFIGAAPDRGMDWLPLVASRGLAVWGLALWVWPLAAVVMAAGLRALDRGVVESLRLERAGGLARMRTLALAAWPSVLAGWALAALVMLGSAVPLHVARVETHAIRVWMVLDEHPAEPWRAWVAAWPLIVLAVAAAWLLSGRLARAGARLGALATGERDGGRAGAPALFAAAAPWVLAVVVPFGLFWSSMGGAGAIGRLLDRAGSGIATSGAVGLIVGALGAVLVLASAQAASAARGQTHSLRIALTLAIAWALLPGVLVGAAIAEVARVLPGSIADSVVPMVVAHLSRWMFLPLLVGVWLGSSEAGGVADARLLDGAVGPLAWARTSLRSGVGPALAAGLACACLSFHEIESSIQVQPPGIDHMAQRLLQWLHYERMAELSAAGVFLLSVGIAGAGLVVIATGLPQTRTRGRPRR